MMVNKIKELEREIGSLGVPQVVVDPLLLIPQLELRVPESSSHDPLNTAQIYTPSREEIVMMAQVIHSEAGAIPDKSHQAAIAWCILNRLDNGYWGDTIEDVITYPHQFAYYPQTAPIRDDLMELSLDVVDRWTREKLGDTDVGRVIPPDYLFYVGDGKENHFSIEWRSREYWNWSLPSPY